MRVRWILAVLLTVLLVGCAPSAPQEPPVEKDPVSESVSKPVSESAAPEKAETTEEPETPEQPAAPTEKEESAYEGYVNAVDVFPEETPDEPAAEEPEKTVKDEAVALSRSPGAVPDIPDLKATGAREARTDKAVIDYSHTEEGYIMACYTAQTAKRLKVQVKGPSTTYTYNLTPDVWEVFPLSDGNGSYQVTIYENVVDNKYAAVTGVSFDVTLKDEFAPFLLPNQYVNYADGSAVVAEAAALAGGEPDTLKKVALVYDYVVSTLTYDVDKAAAVKSGYLPVLDTVLKEKRGICFDYAALMTAMLRSQGVPCKLVVGYAGSAYHAWISVWSEHTGWVDGAIFFDGSVWQRMDPTFASSSGRSDAIMAFIGDGKNYSEKYLY